MNTIIISNTCVGYQIIIRKNMVPYNSPFIAALIPNDWQYLRLIQDFDHYRLLTPVLSEPDPDSVFSRQNGALYYTHKEIRTPYPVIRLGDVEIHFIHVQDRERCLETFKRRLDRMNRIIDEGDCKIVFLLSFSELLNDHEDVETLIDTFFHVHLSPLRTEKYFMGPLKYARKEPGYISVPEWDDVLLKRDSSHVFVFNSQLFCIDTFIRHLCL